MDHNGHPPFYYLLDRCTLNLAPHLIAMFVWLCFGARLGTSDGQFWTRNSEREKREEREEREGRLLDSAAGRLVLRSTKREEVTRVISRVERSRESN